MTKVYVGLQKIKIENIENIEIKSGDRSMNDT